MSPAQALDSRFLLIESMGDSCGGSSKMFITHMGDLDLVPACGSSPHPAHCPALVDVGEVSQWMGAFSSFVCV